MAYSDFTIKRVRKELGITISSKSGLYDSVEPVTQSGLLKAILHRSGRLSTLIGSEKAKSEFLISPILAEISAQLDYKISLFSGAEFNVDEEKGLQGYCDFILSKSPAQIDVTAPIMTIVEAKSDNLKSEIGQCMAEMVAAQIFNQREEQPIETIYGVVTTGTSWLFMQLIGSHIQMDDREYFINEVDHILGILMLPFLE